MNPLNPHDWFAKGDGDFGLAAFARDTNPNIPI